MFYQPLTSVNSLSLAVHSPSAALYVRNQLLHHPAFVGEANGPGKGLVAVLADPSSSSSGQQSQQGSIAGAYIGESDKWPFVIACSHEAFNNGLQLVGLSSRWLSRLIRGSGGGDAGHVDASQLDGGGGGGPLSALSQRESTAVNTNGITAVHTPPGVGGSEANALPLDVDALPLSSLLAAVGRLLPLPQLPPKAGGQKATASSGCLDPEARERVVAHVAAVVLLRDAAAQCRVGKEREEGGKKW